MTSFDESLHPRERSGEFAKKINSAPARGLAAPAGDELPAAFHAVWDGPEEHAREAHARGLFTAIAEPADHDVVRALRDYGADATLRALRSERSDEEVAAEIGVEELGSVMRWRARLGDAERVYRDAELAGLTLHTPAEGGIPARFAELGDTAPIALWVRGDADLLHDMDKSVSIEGSRAATSYGSHAARELGAKAAADGHVVVTGGSYGIGEDALRGSVAAGGRSVVILASGADRPYPAGNGELFDAVVGRGGAVVSETPPGAAPTRWRFMARARLLGAASAATIIVESGSRGGSLNTAENAAALGRPVYAVPGPITSAASTGTNALIRDGKAKLLNSLDDLTGDAAHM